MSTDQKRARDGQGSVREHRPGLWQIRYRTVDDQGREVRKSAYAKSEDAAYALLNARLADRAKGLPPETGHYTVRTWLDAWLRGLPNRRDVRPQTIQNYAICVRRWQRDPIASLQLTKLRAEHVAAAMGRFRADGLGDATRRRHLVVLRMAMIVAMDDGHVHRNVASSSTITIPVAPSRRNRIPSRDELDAIERAILEREDVAYWLLLLRCGLRVGEAAGLRWRDLQLPEGVLTIDRTVLQTRELDDPKSETSARPIYLPDDVLAALEARRSATPGVRPHPDAYIFGRIDGSPDIPVAYWRRWQDVLAAAGLPPKAYRPHDLRHVTAHTLIARYGVERTSKYLGHSDVRITMGYGHVRSTDIRFEREA